VASPGRTIVLLSLAAFASAASMRVTDAMLPWLASTHGVGLAGAANAITYFAIAYGAMQMAFGPLGDRFGKLRVIGGAGCVAAIATWGCTIAPTFELFLVARLVAGAFCGAIIPLAMAWIGDVVPYAERQPVIARFLLGQILGLGVGSAFGGYAVDHSVAFLPFLVLAAWLLATSIALTLAAARDPAPRGKGGGNFVSGIAGVLRTRWARVVCATVFLEGIVVFGALAFVPTHLHFARGLPLGRAGLALLVFAAGGIVFAFFARPVIRRLGEAGLAVAGTAMIAVGFVLVAWTPHVAIGALGCLGAGLGFYMLHNTLQANATQMAPERRGVGMALFASLYFVGQALGVAAAGHVAEGARAGLVIVASAVLILPIGLGFALLRARRGAAE
jgi:predicted MFS family arabinose efflux permease